MDTTRPTARALLVLEVLQDSPGISADRLAARLGVTDRAVRRYVGLLRDVGIPIESTTGRYGGYRLGRGTRLPPLMLSPAEALGLVMAVLQGRPDAVVDADAADPVGTAIGKIVRVLPASVAESVTVIRHGVTSRPAADSAAPDPVTTAALVQASQLRRRVRITYQLRQERVMDVDPWAVSVWRGHWYLLCWSHTSAARRVLRVDRVRSAVALDEAFTMPADLDPIAAIEEQMSLGWRLDVDVVVDAPLEVVTNWLPRSLGRLAALDPLHTRLVGSTNEPLWYARHLTALEAPYRIVSPPELREAAAEIARRLLYAAAPVPVPADEPTAQSPSSSPTNSSRPKNTADSRALGVPASGSAPPATSARIVASSTLETAPASGV
jgi:predicted DNA-binding transcriptional regulator YafY